MAEKNKYELMVIIHPDTGTEGAQKKVDELKDLVKEAGGEVWHEEDWGLRELEYKIQRQEKGFYYILNFDLPSDKMKKIDKHLKLEKEFLRGMFLKLPNNYEITPIEDYFYETDEEKEAKKERKEVKKHEKKAKRIGKVEEPAKEEPVKEEEPAKEEPVKEETPEEAPKAEAPKEAPKEEEKESDEDKEDKEEKARKKQQLDELDEKLKSIINDSDIIL